MYKDVGCGGSAQCVDLGLQKLENGTFEWKVEISTPPFRSGNIILTVHAEKRLVKAVEIERVQSQISELEREEASVLEEKEGMQSEIKAVAGDMDALTKKIDLLTREETFLSDKQIDLATYSKLKALYSGAPKDTKNLVRALTRRVLQGHGV